jgi:hypothetical protein
VASDATEDDAPRTVAATPKDGDAPGLGAVAPAATASGLAAAERAGLRVRLTAAASRYGDSVALATVAIVYSAWPNGLAPDRKWYGGIDDVVFFLLLAFFARRAIKRSPTLLDLPSAVSRAVRARFRVNR